MRKIPVLALLALSAISLQARTVTSLNGEWQFKFENDAWQNVSVPHTWNAKDAADGIDRGPINGRKIAHSVQSDGYKRGAGYYKKALPAPKKGKRYFFHSEGASIVTDVSVNGTPVGQHKGAFTGFCYDITDALKTGQANEILLKVDNTFNADIAPISGDFSMFGGLYRNVSVIETDSVYIDPTFKGSSGVLLNPAVNGKDGTLGVRVYTSVGNNTRWSGAPPTLNVRVTDPQGAVVAEKTVNAASENPSQLSLNIPGIQLWNSVEAPNLYRTTVTLSTGSTTDIVEQNFGFRTFSVDPKRGVILNGKARQIKGVNRHQDREGKGWAVSAADEEEDMLQIREMGADGLRLAHYPQSINIYDLADKLGIMLWSEVSGVDCITESEAFYANFVEQAEEMVYQHYNHPSVLFWGIFNEMYHNRTVPPFKAEPLLRKTKDRIKEIDPGRIVVAASNQGGRHELNRIPEALAFNTYPGWYGGGPKGMEAFIKGRLKDYGDMGIGISEYGHGSSIHHHEDPERQPKPIGDFHPEEWQTIGHLENYRCIKANPACWGSFIWAMWEFASAERREGERDGMNDKGLVTYDRKTKKDAFYFYKAVWNPEPMVYLRSKRFTERKSPTVTVKGFSNTGAVTLTVNGKDYPAKEPNDMNAMYWGNVELKPGKNTIRLSAKAPDGKTLTDEAVWNYTPTTPTPNPDQYISIPLKNRVYQ